MPGVTLENIISIAPNSTGQIEITSDLNLVGTAPVPRYLINGVPLATGGGTPAGANTQVQYNSNGAFGASANFVWNGSNMLDVKSSTLASGIIRVMNNSASGVGLSFVADWLGNTSIWAGNQLTSGPWNAQFSVNAGEILNTTGIGSNLILNANGVLLQTNSPTVARLFIQPTTGNVSIGSRVPATAEGLIPFAKLHVRAGASGVAAALNTDTVVFAEHSSNAYYEIVAAEGFQAGLVMGANGQTNTGQILNRFDGTNHYLQLTAAPAGSYMTFYTAGLERARITAAGNVGIGTANPGRPVHVVSSIAVFELQSTTDNAGLQLNTPTGGDCYLQLLDNRFRAYVGGAERFCVLTNGNVGIGTAAPAFPLHMYAPGSGMVARFGNDQVNLDLGAMVDGTGPGIDSQSWSLSLQTGGATRIYVGADGRIALGGTYRGSSAFMVTASGGRSLFVANSEPYGVGFAYNSSSSVYNYVGTDGSGNFGVYNANGNSLMSLNQDNWGMTIYGNLNITGEYLVNGVPHAMGLAAPLAVSEDAPSDGRLYGRRNGAWVEIA